MARSSKDSLLQGTMGFLFGSDGADASDEKKSQAEKSSPESAGPQPRSTKTKTTKRAKKTVKKSEDPAETVNSTPEPTFNLFGAPAEPAPDAAAETPVESNADISHAEIDQPAPESNAQDAAQAETTVSEAAQPEPVAVDVSDEIAPFEDLPTPPQEEPAPIISEASPIQSDAVETPVAENVATAENQQERSVSSVESTEPSPEEEVALSTAEAGEEPIPSASSETVPLSNPAPSEPVVVPTAEAPSASEPAPNKVSESSSPSLVPVPAKPAAYQVVARRYRPQAFNELIGQETVARALSNAIETNRVGHAYLFTGARGVGKTSCARIFAKALNCVEGPTTRPCLKCDSCIGVSTGEDVDVIEIDGASNRGVDEIRLLRQNATIAPSRSNYKIYIIDEVHMLTREAFNALLKTLEEPPARVKFIFCTTEPNKIPITILSRCQRFDFSSINGASISSRLEMIAKEEGAQAEEGVFDILARRANGSMRDAQSLLEQLLSFAPSYISQADVHNMLGSVDDRKIFELLDATVNGDAKKVFEALGNAANQGVDFGTLVEQTLGVYRDLMVVASGCGPKELAYSPVARFEELKSVAEAFGIRRILASLQILDQTAQRMRYSAQTRILAELAFARLCRLDAFQTIEALIEQLKDGTIPNLPLSVSANVEDDKKKIKSQPIALNVEFKAIEDKRPEPENVSSSQYQGTVVPNPASSVRDAAADAGIPSVPETRPVPDAPDAIPSDPGNVEPSEPRVPAFSAPNTNVAAESTTNSYSSPAPSSAENADSALWGKLTQKELMTFWTEATNSGIVLPSHASVVAEIRIDPPRTFTVVFPEGKQIQKDYCENERASILGRLTTALGSEPNLRFIIDPNVKPRSDSSSSSASAGSDNYRGEYAGNQGSNYQRQRQPRGEGSRPATLADFRELRRHVEESKIAHEIQEIFEAELTEVKPPAPPAKKRGVFGNLNV